MDKDNYSPNTDPRLTKYGIEAMEKIVERHNRGQSFTTIQHSYKLLKNVQEIYR